MKSLRRQLTVLGVSFIMAAGAAVAKPPKFRVVEIEGLPSLGKSVVTGLNNNDEVVGITCESKDSCDNRRTFIWTAALGATQVDYVPANSIPDDINDSGVIIGRAPLMDRDAAYMAKPESGSEIISPTISWATGLNQNGEVAGLHWDYTTDYSNGFYWEEVSGGTSIGDLFHPSDINLQRQVVGVRTYNQDTYCHEARIFDVSTGVGRDLGSLSGSDCPHGGATSINDNGVVVGYSDTKSGSVHAFIWDPINGMRDLSAKSPGNQSATRATDLNNAGQIVGTQYKAGFFYWDATSGFYQLSKLVSKSDPLKGRIVFYDYLDPKINNRGHIIVHGILDGDGIIRPFFLYPDK